MRPVGIAPLNELRPFWTQILLPLAGGPYGFTHLDLSVVRAAGYQAARVSIAEARRITKDEVAGQLAAITGPRPAFAVCQWTGFR